MKSAETQRPDVQAIRANKLALVERLADDLAHEIKNPLHSMVINLEVLKRRITRLGQGETGDLLRYTGVLGGELDRITGRVELLLRLVRPDRGAEPTTLGQTVEELLDVVDLARERNHVSIDFTPASRPVRGHLPRELARQITLNLLIEALDLLPGGGTLDLRTEIGETRATLRILAIAPPGGEVTLPAPAPGNGSAPRLSIARALAESLRGELEVDGHARSDDGSPAVAFTLSIPLAGH